MIDLTIKAVSAMRVIMKFDFSNIPVYLNVCLSCFHSSDLVILQLVPQAEAHSVFQSDALSSCKYTETATLVFSVYFQASHEPLQLCYWTASITPILICCSCIWHKGFFFNIFISTFLFLPGEIVPHIAACNLAVEMKIINLWNSHKVKFHLTTMCINILKAGVWGQLFG